MKELNENGRAFWAKLVLMNFLPNGLSYKKSLELDMQIERLLTLH